jgi:uncharacterized protein YecE (DUF72 family)
MDFLPGPPSLPGTYLGTSGWSLSRALAPGSAPELSGLERYSEYFNCVEINSTFYRLPIPSTLERWRDSTPAAFRFSVKLPRLITHEARLQNCTRELAAFCQLVLRLEPKLGPLLVQLPPSLAFQAGIIEGFLAHLSRAGASRVVIEPRHVSWFSPLVDDLLKRHGVARVATDPSLCLEASEPAGARRVSYFRWHGSPRRYFSSYPPEAIAVLAAKLAAVRSLGSVREIYCFFDNTALGAAAVNALSLKSALAIRG